MNKALINEIAIYISDYTISNVKKNRILINKIPIEKLKKYIEIEIEFFKIKYVYKISISKCHRK